MCFGIKKYVPLIAFTIRIALVGLISYHYDVAYSASHQTNHILNTSHMNVPELDTTETDLAQDKAAEKPPKKNIKKELLHFLDSARNRMVQTLKTPIVRYGALVTGIVLAGGYAILSSSSEATLANRETLPQTASPENCIEASEKEAVNQLNSHSDEDCTPETLTSKSMQNPIKRPTVDMSKLSCSSNQASPHTAPEVCLAQQPQQLPGNENENILDAETLTCTQGLDAENKSIPNTTEAESCLALHSGINTLPLTPSGEVSPHTTPEVFLTQDPQQLPEEEKQDAPDAVPCTCMQKQGEAITPSEIETGANDPIPNAAPNGPYAPAPNPEGHVDTPKPTENPRPRFNIYPIFNGGFLNKR